MTFAIAKRIGDTPEEVDRTYAHLYPNKGQGIARELSRHRDGFAAAGGALDEDGDVYNDKEIAESLEAEQVFHNNPENVEYEDIAEIVEPN